MNMFKRLSEVYWHWRVRRLIRDAQRREYMRRYGRGR